MKRITRVFARPQKAETKAKAKYYCCACGHHGRRKHLCAFCSSEDVFDKTLPEWPCTSCSDDSATFQDTCIECKKKLLGVALAQLFEVDGADDDDDLNPQEDFGDSDHKIFRGHHLRDAS